MPEVTDVEGASLPEDQQDDGTFAGALSKQTNPLRGAVPIPQPTPPQDQFVQPFQFPTREQQEAQARLKDRIPSQDVFTTEQRQALLDRGPQGPIKRSFFSRVTDPFDVGTGDVLEGFGRGVGAALAPIGLSFAGRNTPQDVAEAQRQILSGAPRGGAARAALAAGSVAGSFILPPPAGEPSDNPFKEAFQALQFAPGIGEPALFADVLKSSGQAFAVARDLGPIAVKAGPRQSVSLLTKGVPAVAGGAGEEGEQALARQVAGTPGGKLFIPRDEGLAPPAGEETAGGKPPHLPPPEQPNFAPPPHAEFPRFTEPVENAIKAAKNLGVSQESLAYAKGEASRIMPDVGNLRRVFNVGRAIYDPNIARDAQLQQAYLSAAHLSESLGHVNQLSLGAIKAAAEEAFGPEALKGAPTLASSYIPGSIAFPAEQKLIGQLFHVIDSPESYRLTPLQARAVNEINFIKNAQRDFLEQSGLPIGEIRQSYIPHHYTNPEEARSAFSSGGKAAKLGGGVPSSFKGRELTLNEFAELGEKLGLDVETDVMRLYAGNFASGSRALANKVLADSLVSTGLGRVSSSPGIGESIVRIVGKNYAFDQDIAQQLRPILERTPTTPPVQVATAVLNAAKSSLFASYIMGGTHFIHAFAQNPLLAIESIGDSAKVLATKYGRLQWYTDNVARTAQWSDHGLRLNVTALDLPVGGIGAPAPPIERIPGIGKALTGLNKAQFETYIPIHKVNAADAMLETLQAVRDGRGMFDQITNGLPFIKAIKNRLGGDIQGMSDAQLMDAVSNHVNNQMGGIDWAKIRNNPSALLPQALLLTEGWFRAQIGLLAKAPALAPEGIMARRLLVRELGLAAGLSTSLSLALSGQLPGFDPRSQKFLDIKTGAGDIRAFPLKNYLGTIIRTAAGKKPGEFGSDDPFYQQRLDSLASFFDSRQGQTLRIAKDTLSGTDFAGRPIGNPALHAVKQITPIALGRVIEDIGQGASPGEIAGRATSELFGATIVPPSKTQRLDDYIASLGIDAQGRRVGIGGPGQVTKWFPDDNGNNGLDPKVRAQLGQSAGAQEIERRYQDNVPSTTFLARQTEREALEQQKARDLELTSGRWDGAKWRDAMARAADEAAARRDLKAKLDDFQVRAPQTANDQALEGYYRLQDKFRDADTNEFDRVGYRDAVDNYLGTLPRAQADYVNQNIHPNATPVQQQYFDLLRKLQGAGFWDAWKQDPRLASAPAQWQEFAQKWADARHEGPKAVTGLVAKLPLDQQQMGRNVIENLSRFEREARINLRLKDPELDSAYTLFFDRAAVTPEGIAAHLDRIHGQDQLGLLVQKKGTAINARNQQALTGAGIRDLADLAQRDTVSVARLSGLDIATVKAFQDQARAALAASQRRKAAA